MDVERKVEVFSAGCACCDEAVELVNRIASPPDEVDVMDMHQADVAERAEQYGIKSVPAVVIDGQLAGCCANRGVDEETLRSAGLGEPN
jgi:glutaredoxin 3